MFSALAALLACSLTLVSGQPACSTSNYSNFTMSGVYTVPPTTGPASVPLNIHMEYTILKRSGSVLAAIAPEYHHSFYMTDGRILADSSTPAWTWPDLLLIGESPMWITQGYYPGGYTGFCLASTTNGVILGADGRTDAWSLCTNTSSAARPLNRLDVVWEAAEGHRNYTLSNCKAINILVTPV